MKFPEYIERPLYLDRIMPFVQKDLMKILVGQRRVGKSYMLFQLMDRIAAIDPGAQQIYINKEREAFAELRSHRELLGYIADRRKEGCHLYLFIDEVQEIVGFEKALRSLQAEGGIDIYATGSNARRLSGELATGLSGRYIEIRIHGLTYPEFLTFHGLSDDRESFSAYLKIGGLPYLRHLPSDETVVFEYLRNITDAILLKDVVARYDIRNVAFLLRLARFLADNVGSLVTARKISDYLKSQKIKVSHNLVLDYLGYLCNAMLVSRVNRMDIAGKRMFEIGEKYYFEDLGLRHALVGYRVTDINKVLENIVFLHLRAAGYEVHVGQVGPREVDFVGEKNGERRYVQVAYLLADEAVRQREFGNLMAISDNFPKVVVTMDEITGGSHEGIDHVHIRDFLRTL
ncbi:MAG: ATP-binding protein [Pseudomonadota bacterium]